MASLNLDEATLEASFLWKVLRCKDLAGTIKVKWAKYSHFHNGLVWLGAYLRSVFEQPPEEER